MATAAKAKEVKTEGIVLSGAEFKRKYKISFSQQAELRKAKVLPQDKDGKTGRIGYTFKNAEELRETLDAVKAFRSKPEAKAANDK